MKRLNLLTLLLFFACATNAQITNTSITLTAAYDQIKFEPLGYNRYFFMSKPVSSIAFGHYSPDDGGWFTYWKTGSGDMIIKKGSVGIGTISPQANLHISAGTAGNATLRIEADVDNNNESDNPILEYRQDGGQVGAYLGFDNVNFGSNIFGIGTRYLGADKWNVLAINTQNGNVGIGTLNPTAWLHILNNEGIKIDDSSNGFPGIIKMTDGFSNTTTKDDLLFESDGAFLFKLDKNGNGISNLPGFGIFDKNDNIIFFAKDNGNVGIGKLTPTAKLHVDGKIVSEEIEVRDVTGADFVFAPNYNLMPLTEIEAFIKANHHLPEVPSATEMQANGVELGKINMLLLQKIEELTLLMIEQNKKIELLLKKAAKQDEELN